MITAATIDAFPDWIWPTFLRKSMTIGTLPTISITAKRIIVADAISLRLKVIIFIFKGHKGKCKPRMQE